MGAAATKLQPSPVNVRVKISALWASMLFVFAYVDLFSLYRPDFRADIEAGEVAGFAVNQTFLLGTTAYVVIPSLMVFCVLVMQPRLNRIVNIALAVLYTVSIVAATIGEWSYYLLGSLIESALLAAVVFYAWTWPKEIRQTG
jgi:membrane protein DedA with SNARE-associated domain